MTKETATDVVIVGGGVGGVAAALALADAGVRCILIEPSRWVGGQLTNQGVPADENRWVESFGATRSYARFRSLVRQHYRDHEAVTDQTSNTAAMNPGGGWVSRLCCSPRIAHGVLVSMLHAAGRDETIDILTSSELIAVDVERDQVRSVTIKTEEGSHIIVTASLFLEASESGDLLELGSVEHRVGAEGAAEHHELHAPETADERCQQPPTWCFAVEYRPESTNNAIERPSSYDTLRSWIPTMHDRPWPGPLFSWVVPTHGDKATRTFNLVPPPIEPSEWELWRYRRIVDASQHTDGRADVSLFNVVQMDDWREPILTLPRDQRAAAFDRARELSKCFLYWMQTEAPRHDGGVGYPELALNGAELGTHDGFAMMPYIREPRRLEAIRMLTEADIGSEQRHHLDAGAGDVPPEGRCEPFADSIAIGHYHIDLHPTPTGRNSIYVESAPFQIPLRSLVHRRISNVIAAGKCLGVTHIVNGATRTHAVEWAIGEAAGVAAALCVLERQSPQSLCASEVLTERVRSTIESRGAPTRWPWDPA